MDVQLYVYDLSRGLARQLSGSLLGTQIDAVYHTSLVFGEGRGVEYFFGAGVQTSYPGSTHHGQPMEVVPMGKTEIDLATIHEYLESLKAVYTAESYDLFENNCNNFTNDFAMFLVGRGIPKHITSLPATVLATPFGQMLKPQLDQAMRGFTQAPVAQSAVPPVLGSGASHKPNGVINGSARSTDAIRSGRVQDVTNLAQLDSLLDAAKSSGAVIFFTSQTCPPCKICYPAYDTLAEEAIGKLILIKVDISRAMDISMRHQVRATPTFMTFLHGSKLDEWKGADVAALQGNVRLLIEMAHPSHPHTRFSLPTLRNVSSKPILFAKVPPLDKVAAQLGDKSNDPAIQSLIAFVKTRSNSLKASDAALPDMPSVCASIEEVLSKAIEMKVFPFIDLVRLALVDPRVSGYFAGEAAHKSFVVRLLDNATSDTTPSSYSTQITTVQAICNLFSSSLLPPILLGRPEYAKLLVALVTSSLLDEAHAPLRVSAASLALNTTTFMLQYRRAGNGEILQEELQTELAAGLLEAVTREANADALKALLLAIGQLALERNAGSELDELFDALQAAEIVQAKSKALPQLSKEVSQLLAKS